MLRRRVGSVVTAAVLMVMMMGLHNTPLAAAAPTLGAGCTEQFLAAVKDQASVTELMEML